LWPLFKVYDTIGYIMRYDRMPFYFAPVGSKVVNYEDEMIKYLDFMVEAHEETRNKDDLNRNMYSRSVYVYNNYMRYQNETMANIMFDTQANKHQYARLNTAVG